MFFFKIPAPFQQLSLSYINAVYYIFQSQSESTIEAKKERAIFRLGTKLTQAAKNSCLDENGLHTYLQGLKAQYYRDIENMEE